jgi:hypothetical protein
MSGTLDANCPSFQHGNRFLPRNLSILQLLELATQTAHKDRAAVST